MVKDHTPVDADRENIAIRSDGRTPFYELLVRAAFADLQTHIEYYRFEHETLFRLCDVVADGMASKFSIPGDGGAKITQIKQVYRKPNPNDSELTISQTATATWAPWSQRDALICGRCSVLKPVVTIQPGMEIGYIYPPLQTTSEEVDTVIDMVVIWDGVKREFKADDTIRAGNEEAEVCSYYVLSKLDRQIREVGIADRHWENYLEKRKQLYIERLEQAESIGG